MAGRPTIKNLLKKGNVAKFYLLAYPRDVHGYRLAQRKYPKIDAAYYSRLGSRYGDLFHTKIVIREGRTRKYYKSRAEPLLEQIKSDLREQGEELKGLEEKTLLEFLDGPFRQQINVEEALEEPSPLWYFKNEIGMHALTQIRGGEHAEDGEEQLNKAYEELGERLLGKLAKLPSPALLKYVGGTPG